MVLAQETNQLTKEREDCRTRYEKSKEEKGKEQATEEGTTTNE